MTRALYLMCALLLCAATTAAQGLTRTEADAPVATARKVEVAPSVAWRVGNLGERYMTDIDTLMYNYFQRAVPGEVSDAYATTGNLGAEGLNMIYAEREQYPEWFFNRALSAWLPSQENQRFYNTRIPMTLLSYNFGGTRDNSQDRLQAIFSGNATKRIQIGARLDYLYSKGSYNYQATNDLAWGVSGSYLGERWQLQLYYNHWNFLNKENGGITDPLYITDPAEVQGGDTRVDAKTIPTRLSAAHTRLVGRELFVNNRYNFGFWREEAVDDTTVTRTYVPALAVLWTLRYTKDRHMFRNDNASQGNTFWANRYLTEGNTLDVTRQWAVENIVGVEMMEGFNRWIPFGLTAYARYTHRRIHQAADTVPHAPDLRPAGLTPWPEGADIRPLYRDDQVSVGAVVARRTGRAIGFDAKAEFGILGGVLGETEVGGNIYTRFKLGRDTAMVQAFAHWMSKYPPALFDEYVSNHFVWRNRFGMQRDVRLGGEIDFPLTGTKVTALVDNVQNAIYIDPEGYPRQHGPSVQVLSVRLEQDLRLGIFNWRNRITWQTTANDAVIPLPQLAVYSNMYLQFRIARVLHVQLGLDCDYYTRYYAPLYQPATMLFANQRTTKVGNYPFVTAYANFKLKRARFYVMMTHVNQGLFSNDYFSMPDYPLNPRRFQLGVSVDFAN